MRLLLLTSVIAIASSQGHFDCEKIDIPENCTEVTLANHKVGNKGAIDIAKYIGMNDNVKKLCNLEVLGMSSCGIGGAGARALGKSLQKNHVLTQLQIGGNDIRPKTEHTIMESVKANKDAAQRREYQEWLKKQEESERSKRSEEL
eukprot:gene22915-26217_t